MKRKTKPLTPPFPARFWGDEFRARLDALMAGPSRPATPCTICGQLMIARAGSAHVACVTGELPTGSTRFWKAER